jgi:hypothetical protein
VPSAERRERHLDAELSGERCGDGEREVDEQAAVGARGSAQPGAVGGRDGGHDR